VVIERNGGGDGLPASDVWVVVIGRNEGERLRRCLQSLRRQSEKIVYVDSGSADGSADYAESVGVDVVRLDVSTPLCAGRARNEGFDRVLRLWPDATCVQFVDGDCELDGEWLRLARRYLAEHSSWAIVAGRVQERYPEKSVYNLLCDMEWNTPVGEVEACGGIFMARVAAFQEVAGFDQALIAGEEPELCYRLRQKGWRIHRLDHPMAVHDAAMVRFSQWWRRSVRSGHAYAQGAAIQGRSQEGENIRRSVGIWFWGAVVPMASILVAWPRVWLAAVIVCTLYGVQVLKIMLTSLNLPYPLKAIVLYSFFMVMAKIPQLLGQMTYGVKRLSRETMSIIEYK
jgi:GT2 family glycosyltransferase